MKMFSDCSDCKHCVLHYYNSCLAGHGDDDFSMLKKKDFDILMNRETTPKYIKEELVKYFPQYCKKKMKENLTYFA